MKSAIVGEYIIQVEQSGHVTVYRIYDNVKESLREIYNVRGLEYNDKWTTRQMGSNLIKQLGGDNSVTVGEYVVVKRNNGAIETYRDFGNGNVKEALRSLAKTVGMEVNPVWNTQTLGSKIIDFVSI